MCCYIPQLYLASFPFGLISLDVKEACTPLAVFPLGFLSEAGAGRRCKMYIAETLRLFEVSDTGRHCNHDKDGTFLILCL